MDHMTRQISELHAQIQELKLPNEKHICKHSAQSVRKHESERNDKLTAFLLRTCWIL